MLETSNSDSRSHKGCWTCRARRKKCDESSQPCKTCSGLRLICHGYGPRPDWMDRGEKEKAKVLEFKAIVKRNLKQKRRSTVTSQSEAGFPNFESRSSQSDGEEIRVQHPLPSPLSPFENTGFDFASTFSGAGNQTQTRNENDFENLFSSNSLEEYIDLDTMDNFPWDVDTQTPNEQDPFASPETTHVESVSTVITSDGSTSSSQISEILKAASSISETTSPDRVLAQWTHDKPATSLTPADQIIIDGYFQQSFASQLPFLDESTSSSIAEQLSRLAARSRACLESLALHAVRSKTFTLNGLGLDISRDTAESANAYEQTVMRCIRRFDSTNPNVDLDITAIEAQICAVQMIHSRIICRYPTWHHQMDVLASVKPVDYNRAAAGEFDKLEAFQELLICLDILASTTTGASPIFALQFSEDFARGTVRLENIVGCSTEVLTCIMHISELQAWSHQQSETGSSSFLELARRALKIEHELEIAVRMNNETRIPPDNPGRRTRRTHDIQSITNIFASAATIYLHATISGARPKIPEIKTAVLRTIASITAISNPDVIKLLTWPR
ncbi:Hypothetical protein R9X50_00100500 [Acrodontium crateriforme]|uniref:Zn(2)-C6 fungal-type domain-containing protein n=1 Tax=Acrodontium crateriforme TaxID=150365 RepID=A0AAQ3LYC3_9PEZI|nr:Hypothetical protein R9X50_00100500 [Acrodontium crateriforme]